ncbi:putative PEP-binding protein [Labrys wisconsinensis]|uniref:Phosphotransferase system enzyme I (PtsI) n=1 Tax=Labrys wisconsinensis TaxID=425677 RepID=A0ABU0JH05_9HYPH|nr:putative PEP-binding protein [Labrys wisconsinensis]MDQ0473572.1 phosphotransferase system enzyme I (PtsI) [Labrys wisconsinensis]
MTELRLSGRAAAPGLAIGPVVAMAAATAARAATGDPAREAGDLRAALAAAAAEITALAERSDGEAADILAFQVAMLEDAALAEGAFHAIEAGIPADHAWRQALAAEIEGYEAAEDEYFRARAADLVDIRDRVLAHLTGTAGLDVVPRGAILAAEDLTPSRFLATDWSAGGAVVLAGGSPSSHVAMLARARGVPMVVALGETPAGRVALVDGDRGVVVVEPGPQTRQAFEGRMEEAAAAGAAALAFRDRPAAMADGTPVSVLINIAEPAELDGLDPAICDGIGLVRTEFLFHAGRGLPDEEAQLAVYARIAAWARGRPVTIRTLDAGGDKPIAGLTVQEANPFLGLRGIRLSLTRPEVFRVQLRALARAAVHGNVKVMLPMVAVPAELERAGALLDEAVADLKAAGLPHARPPLGIMVEVPAAAISATRFPAAFYSIGSNDLTQYTMAAARDLGAVAELNDAGDPAVLALIASTVAAGAARGVEVSLCGDAGADLSLLPKLLATGLRAVSVAPVAVARVKAAIARC